MRQSRFILALGLLLTAAVPATAQLAALTGGHTAPVSSSEPVTFQADHLTYDRDSGIVTATGNVEAWQNDHVLRADTVTYDRNTNVAAASGHVALVEPDGQVLFSDYAELTGGFREGILKGIRARLAANGRLVANGARRTGGQINELSRIVYTTCNLCKQDPSAPPLWDIRASSAVQDSERKRIEYRDATLDIYGYPVAYFPYFWHADPSVKRESGFLVPSVGSSSNIGAFVAAPYYWVLDDQSDVTLTPLISAQSGPDLSALYRRRFNDGAVRLNGAFGRDRGSLQGYLFARGNFSYNDTWRYGFDIQRASSSIYLRDIRFQSVQDVLNSRIFVEGFGVGAYSRLDALAYQGLTASINQSRLPYVLPRYQYDFFGQPDALGGRFSLETQNFNVTRAQGTNTQRLAARLNWERPATGSFGEVYTATLRTDTAAYQATSLNQNPNFSPLSEASTAFAQPQAALKVRWPFVHDGALGNQLVEPIAQIIAAPNTGGYRQRLIPNEDSQDFEFTDQNLFSLNRYPGLDRQEGGVRFNTALHGNWTLGQGNLDALIGESFRLHRDNSYLPGSGLERRASDIVTRTSLSPAPWLDLTGRTRLDHRSLRIRFADVVASAGAPILRLGIGYLRTNTNPYTLSDFNTIPAAYFTPRDEATLNASTRFGYYSASAYARRDLATNRMVSAGVRATYEDECFIFDANVSRRYTSLNGDSGSTLVLFQVTFKTVGQFGFHAF